MYCTKCGAKNPDDARFCCGCGSAMGGTPAAQTRPVQKKTETKKSGGLFTRIVSTIIAFAVFYGASYVVTSLTSGKKSEPKSTTSQIKFEPAASSEDLFIQPAESQLPVQTEAPKTGYIADLGGSWESVYIQDGNFNLNVSALSFGQTIYNCTGLTVTMDVTMNAGTSCKDWNVWGRSGGTFVKIAKIYLPSGNGYTSQNVTFATPVTFDAIAVTPTIVGGYSWSMSLGITDVYYK